MIYFLIIVAIYSLERSIKLYVEKNKTLHEKQYYLKNKLIIHKYHNKGVALNFLEKHVNIVKLLTGVIIGGLLVLLSLCIVRKKESHMFKLGLAMILGGAISNFGDRIEKGYVTDYFSFNVGKRLKTIIFNIADMFVFLGSILVLFAEILSKNK